MTRLRNLVHAFHQANVAEPNLRRILQYESIRGITRDLRLAASLELIGADEAAIAIRLGPINMLGVPSRPTSMSMPFAMHGAQPMHLDATDEVPTRALAVGADDIAAELVARVMLRLKEMR